MNSNHDTLRRLDQIGRTVIRVRPTDVGKWAATGSDLPLSPAEAVVIAPADLHWLLAAVRGAHA